MNTKIPVSVLVLTHNEIDFIPRCLRSVAWAGEIVVIDDFSTDGTVEQCRSFGAIVHQRNYDFYGAQSQWGLQHCHNEWIFQIDADEECSVDLAQEITTRFQEPLPHTAFRIPIRPVFLGREIRHGNWGTRQRVRLFRNKDAVYQGPKNHEHITTPGTTGALRSHYFHYTVYDFERWFVKQIQYARYKVEDAERKSTRFSLIKMMFHPLFHFFNAYIRRLGFLDGMPGFLIATVGSFTIFLRYGLLLEKEWKKTQ